MIGEGGMGSVYLSSQTEPVKRQVALKLIKTGMDSRGVLARFEAERQALALMDHPNIARIYDGGVTSAGQPFFVMELVHGVPLTEYCDQKRLTVKARLELFVAVCQAVQHAHQKGIIHRDLKPGYVLVTEVHGRPTPKVIDFGVAKATEVNLTDMTFSDTGAIVGTPAYMSPEQADPSSMDIDTRTDVYAIGVMLYELLTLVGGIVGTSLGMAFARQAQKAEAEQRANAVVQRDKAIASETKAREEAAKTQAINDFLTQDLLTQAEPANNAVEDKVTLLEVLDRAAEKVGTRFAGQPELEGALRRTIAYTYHGLASWKKAETQVRAALDSARQRDPESAETDHGGQPRGQLQGCRPAQGGDRRTSQTKSRSGKPNGRSIRRRPRCREW